MAEKDAASSTPTRELAANSELLLSIVIPAFRDETSLRQLISDVFAQDLGPELYEIIIVDDGSPEPLLPKLEDLLKDCRVAFRCFRKPNGGGPSARNYGARVARGKLVMFLDQDMRIPENFVRVHVEVHMEVGHGAVSAYYENRLSVEEGPFCRWYAEIWKNLERGVRQSGKQFAPGIFKVHPILLTSTNVSLPRRLFEDIEGFPVYRRSGVEDQAFGLILGGKGIPVFRIDRATALHAETRARLQQFCERQRVGMAATVELIRQFRDVFGELRQTEQHRINGPIRPKQDPLALTVRKLAKSMVMRPGVLKITYLLIRCLEFGAPNSLLLKRAYDAVLSAHLQKGWREGLRDCVP